MRGTFSDWSIATQSYPAAQSNQNRTSIPIEAFAILFISDV